MSVKTDALEDAVTNLLQARAAMQAAPGAHGRAAIDRAFARLLRLAAPRIRHFIMRYGLTDMTEDAEQVCAIALHRAVLSYDPGQAKFTTFVNWQLRGELQSLRFRVRTDARGSARKVSAATLSFETLGAADGTPFDQLVRDEEAEDRTASGAAALMARRAAGTLIDDWVGRRRAGALKPAGGRTAACRRSADQQAHLPKFTRARPGTVDPDDLAVVEARLAHERQVVRNYLCGREAMDRASSAADARGNEQDRQIVRRALRDISAAVMDGRVIVPLRPN